jgi:hypothetical protein
VVVFGILFAALMAAAAISMILRASDLRNSPTAADASARRRGAAHQHHEHADPGRLGIALLRRIEQGDGRRDRGGPRGAGHLAG